MKILFFHTLNTTYFIVLILILIGVHFLFNLLIKRDNDAVKTYYFMRYYSMHYTR